MPKLCEKELCCGCGACSSQCPTNALTLQSDDLGFIYPEINSSLCCECNKCTNSCPVINSKKVYTLQNLKIAYAGYSLNHSVIMNSSSGATAYSLYKAIIEQSGVVFGVRYKSDYRGAEYVEVNQISDLPQLQKSKYVETDRTILFNNLDKALQRKKMVLVIGTPCDIAAINTIFGYRENLFTCKLICQGTTSNKAFNDYLDNLEKIHLSKISKVDLRYKIEGQPTFPTWVKIDFENGKSYIGKWTEQDYYRSFFIMNRDSCSNCSFKKDNGSIADLTLGDFQGISNKDDFYNHDGVSLILAHTKRGLKLLNFLKNNFYLKKVSYKDTVKYNWMINKSYPTSPFKKEFSDNFKKFGLTTSCELLKKEQNDSIKLISENILKSNSRVAIWGAGGTTLMMYEKLHMSEWNIIDIYDTSTLRIGKLFKNYTVKNISDIGKNIYNIDLLVVMIPSVPEENLLKDLKTFGWTKDIINVGKYKYW